MLDTLVHGLEGIANIGSQQLWVNADKGVVHPRLMPLQPVSHCDPEVLVRVKVTQQLANFVIL